MIRGKKMFPYGEVQEGEYTNGSLIKGTVISPDGKEWNIEFRDGSISLRLRTQPLEPSPPSDLTRNPCDLCVIS